VFPSATTHATPTDQREPGVTDCDDVRGTDTPIRHWIRHRPVPVARGPSHGTPGAWPGASARACGPVENRQRGPMSRPCRGGPVATARACYFARGSARRATASAMLSRDGTARAPPYLAPNA